jgi:hypothetical protein
MQLFKRNEDGSIAMVGALVGILLTVVVCVVIYYKVAGSINGLPAAGLTAAAAVNTTAGTVFTLAPIIAIVIIASVILGAIMKFGGGGV